jgi:hypothetical protein
MGRPATVTGPEAIAKTEMISRVMQARFAGLGYREIAAAEGISRATAHRLYWRVIAENPPSRRRQLAARERAALRLRS